MGGMSMVCSYPCVEQATQRSRQTAQCESVLESRVKAWARGVQPLAMVRYGSQLSARS